ncbi:MAG: hypothetical protein JWQ73_2531, partial [Variovorax sp.]|nr:hypothetical protein [Variovorax sp.]
MGLGIGGACDGALGLLAMTGVAPVAPVVRGLRVLRVTASLALLTGMLLAAQGCSSVGGITGAVAGVASASATANPAVGVAVGIGVKAGVDESINFVLRYWTHEEQMRIASMVGDMPVGQRKPWEVRHEVPYDDKQGEVTVVRAFSTPLATCKEALFSVDAPPDAKTARPKAEAPRFVTTVCRGSDGWRWAV